MNYSVTNHKLKHVHTQHNGGFITYAKLYWRFRKMHLSVLPTLPWKQRILYELSVCAKTPWWLLIKPFGWVYSSKTKYSGEYVETNGRIYRNDFDVKKVVTHKLLGLPVFIHPWFFNSTDMMRITKDKYEGFDG